jgi:hypothetical protein
MSKLFVYGVIPSNYTHMDIADAFWFEQIAWVSAVIIENRDTHPNFNIVYVEISGWLANEKGHMNSYKSYKNFGNFQMSIGTFRAVPNIVSKTFGCGTERYMSFPIEYYIHTPENSVVDDEYSIQSFREELSTILDEAKEKLERLPEETDELRIKRDVAYAGAFKPDTKPYYVSPLVMEHLAETKLNNSEWSTKGLAAHYGYNVYDEF